jgi:hypothetical protein
MGLGFDMSNFNEDSSDDVYTFGISMPIRMVQYQDSFTWSKYSHCLFQNDLPNDFPKMMISEMNNVNDLFHQNMTEFLQTDIDGSFEFLLNAITIQSLEKYLKTFYTPPLDIDQISSIWDQIIQNSKTMVTVTEESWECARKISNIPFSIFTSMFHQCFLEHRFLESTLELLQQFYSQVESIAHDYEVFPGDQSKLSPKCLCCGKKITPTELLGKLLFMAPMAISHHLKMLSSVPSVNISPLVLKNMPVLFTSMKNYSASKTLFDDAIYEIAEDDAEELFLSKKNVPIIIVELGNTVFVRQLKLIWQSQKINVKKISSLRKRRINFQAHF